MHGNINEVMERVDEVTQPYANAILFPCIDIILLLSMMYAVAPYVCALVIVQPPLHIYK